MADVDIELKGDFEALNKAVFALEEKVENLE